MACDLTRQESREMTDGPKILMRLPLYPRIDEALTLARRLGEIAGIA